jgi:hypothetical protein
MARGNQREKAREKAQKAAGGVKSKTTVSTSRNLHSLRDANMTVCTDDWF